VHAVTTSGPDVPGHVGVDAVREPLVGVGECTTFRERAVVAADVEGVDGGRAGCVCAEVLGACVGDVERFEVRREFL